MTIRRGGLVRAEALLLLLVVACDGSGGGAENEASTPSTDGATTQGASDAADALEDATIGAEPSPEAGTTGDAGGGASIDTGTSVLDAAAGDGASPMDAGTDAVADATSLDGAGTDAADGSAQDDGGIYLCGSAAVQPASATGTTTILASLGLSRVNGLWKDGDRVAGQDVAGWVLWNAATRLAITQADTGQIAGMAGGVLLISGGDGGALQTISEDTGSFIAPISFTGSAQAGLAIDGSYAWTASSSALTVFSTTGTVLTSQPGDYSAAIIAGAPGNVLVAMGPAGAQVIQTIPTSGAPSTTSAPFMGDFANWFMDGTNFLTTTLDNNVFVYAADATELEVVPVLVVGVLGGYGQYFWNDQTHTYNLVVDVYTVGGSPEPTKTYSPGGESVVIGSGHELGLVADGQLFEGNAPLPGAPVLTVADLQANPLTDTSVTVPFLDISAFASDENGFWTVGTSVGAVLSNGTASAPQQSATFGCGAVAGVAGSLSGRFALATTGAGVIILDMPSATPSHIDLVAGDGPPIAPSPGSFFPGTNNYGLALSSDGRTFAANASDLTPTDDRSLYIFSGPPWTVVQSFPYNDMYQDNAYSFSMSLNGSALGLTAGVYGLHWEYTASLTDVTGTAPVVIESSSNVIVPFPSPDGTHSVISDGYSTRFYNGDTAINAIVGTAAGWLDDNRVLIGPANGSPIQGTPGIYDAQGNLLTTPALPFSAWNSFLVGGTPMFDVIDSNRIFSRVDQTIYDLTSGAALETFAGTGVVAGPFIMSVVGRELRATAY